MSEHLKDLVKRLAGTFNKDDSFTVLGTVVAGSYDKDTRTVSVRTVNDNAEVTIPEVSLMVNANDGWLLIPEDESEVYVTITTKQLMWVSFFSSLSATYFIVNGVIQLQDGTYGGLVKVEALTDKLNQLVTQIGTQLTAIATGIAGAGGSYTPSNPSSFNKSDYENNDVIHGAK